MTHGSYFCLIITILLSLRVSFAQTDAFDEKIRDATNGLNRYERLQRTEKLISQNEADLNALKNSMAEAQLKIKGIDDLKKQLTDIAKNFGDLKTAVEDLKKTKNDNNTSVKNSPTSSNGTLDTKNEGLVVSILNDLNSLKEDSSKQLDLNRKLRLELDAAKLEIRELSKMISELNSKVR